MMSLRDQLQSMDRQQRVEKVRELLTTFRQTIDAALTPEQKAEFDKKLNEARAAIGGGGGAGRAGMLERVRTALDGLNLNDDQRTKSNALLDATKTKLQSLADEKDVDARQAKFTETMRDTREQLAQILTPEQRQALRDRMQDGAGPGTAQPLDRTPRRKQPVEKPATQPEASGQMMMDEMKEAPAKPVVAATAASSSTPVAGPAKPIAAGAVAPDFKLQKVDGPTVQLSSLKNRVVVLVFGSYTCPSFRGRASSIDRLTQELSTGASVFIVYTKEAHPVGGWEVDRNKDENISIKQPANLEARRSVAKQSRDALHLSTPILLDGMDGTVTNAYGGFPNAAVVINRDGTIAGSQQWVETGSLKRIVDEAIAKPAAK
jgi:Spy/CpxP family protein refolding chaperone